MSDCECFGRDPSEARMSRAAQEGMRKLRAFRAAQARYAEAKAERNKMPQPWRVGSPQNRECLDASKAIAAAQKAVWEAFEEWEEAERNLLPLGADHGG